MDYGAQHYTISPKGIKVRVVLHARAFRLWGYLDGQLLAVKKIQIENVLERIEAAFADIPVQHIKAVGPVLYIKVHDRDYFKNENHEDAAGFVTGRRWNLDIPAERTTIHLPADFTDGTAADLRHLITHEFAHCVEYMLTRQEDGVWGAWFTAAKKAAERREALSMCSFGSHLRNRYEFFANHYEYYYEKRARITHTFYPAIMNWFKKFDKKFAAMTLHKGSK